MYSDCDPISFRDIWHYLGPYLARVHKWVEVVLRFSQIFTQSNIRVSSGMVRSLLKHHSIILLRFHWDFIFTSQLDLKSNNVSYYYYHYIISMTVLALWSNELRWGFFSLREWLSIMNEFRVREGFGDYGLFESRSSLYYRETKEHRDTQHSWAEISVLKLFVPNSSNNHVWTLYIISWLCLGEGTLLEGIIHSTQFPEVSRLKPLSIITYVLVTLFTLYPNNTNL